MSAPTVVLVPLAKIDAGDRLRPLEAPWVEAVAASIAVQGLIQPILLRQRGLGFLLVAGAHRLAAAALLGWETISAQVEEMDDLQARLAEVDENLMRRELGALDRAFFLSERKRVWEALHPATTKGGDRKSLAARLKIKRSSCPFDFPDTFTADAAARTGLSITTVKRAVALAGNLSPEAVALLRGTPLAGNAAQLKALARLAPEAQVRAAGAVAAGARNLAAAMIAANLLPPRAVGGDDGGAVGIASASRRATPRGRREGFALALKGLAPAERRSLLLAVWEAAGEDAQRATLARLGLADDATEAA